MSSIDVLIIFVFPSLFSRWFCHFDDDNYVNVHTLVKTLKKFNPLENVYLGRPSLTKAMEVMVMIRWDHFRMHSRLRYPWSESTLEYGPQYLFVHRLVFTWNREFESSPAISILLNLRWYTTDFYSNTPSEVNIQSLLTIFIFLWKLYCSRKPLIFAYAAMGGKKCLAFDVSRVFDVIPYMVMVMNLMKS